MTVRIFVDLGIEFESRPDFIFPSHNYINLSSAIAVDSLVYLVPYRNSLAFKTANTTLLLQLHLTSPTTQFAAICIDVTVSRWSNDLFVSLSNIRRVLRIPVVGKTCRNKSSTAQFLWGDLRIWKSHRLTNDLNWIDRSFIVELVSGVFHIFELLVKVYVHTYIHASLLI